MLRARAQGIDPRPVLPPEQQAEFHLSHALTTDTNDIGVLYPLLRLMSERLGRRLRRRGLTAGRLRVEATYADYTAGARAVLLRAAMVDAELWDAARRGFVLANTKRLAVRAVALTLDRLMEAEAQLELWAGQRVSGSAGQQQHTNDDSLLGTDCPASPLPRCPAALRRAVDRIRARYGAGALHHSTTIFPKVALPSMTRCASAS
jgi:DNA polymerase-4